tara:strand:+ start:57 stop:2324 length:2268 start_codon:yes stop_codon:yes gene_type:complete
MLNINVNLYLKILIKILFISFFSFKLLSNESLIEIKGNIYTDDYAIFSLIEKKPTEITEEYSNYLLKTLDNSMLFESVVITIKNNKYIISIIEYPNINEIKFDLNERFEDDELRNISEQLNLKNLNPISINNFKEEIKKIYESFGYNNVNITHFANIDSDTNTADIFFEINEGTITKIKNIFFSGNDSINNQNLKSIIKSKTKSLTNILANNSYKKANVINDTRIIKNFYSNNGYPDAEIGYTIEYLESNKVNLYFNISEGNLYSFHKIEILDNEKILDSKLLSNVNLIINKSLENKKNYSIEILKEIKSEITKEILSTGIDFFEIRTLEKKENKLISVLFEIITLVPKYTNQINIYGNSRTLDRVIRRELDIAEGDAIHKSQIQSIQNKLNRLNIFKSVEIVEKELENNLVNLEINVEEKQTGSFSAGLSLGTLEGFGLVAGLNEKNFYGTGRSLSFLINTTQDRTELSLETTDRIFYDNNIDVTFKSKYKEEDFTLSSSYKLNTFLTSVGFEYDINPKLRHGIDLEYIIKNYNVSNTSTVSNIISQSAGANVSFVLKNSLIYNNLNSYYLPKKGTFVNFLNFLETPNSSNNGYIKNIITYKRYFNFNKKNILSFQSRIGNITSLNNNDVLIDNKFSLGGRWLRGFDSFGAGPRNSRTSYIGANNLAVTKIDYSRELTSYSDFPLFFNIFNDYGLLWDNKTKPLKNDNNLRSSYGFGLKYYSAIGPIGLTWGFPIQDESYDIKRMFLFSIGNIN